MLTDERYGGRNGRGTINPLHFQCFIGGNIGHYQRIEDPGADGQRYYPVLAELEGEFNPVGAPENHWPAKTHVFPEAQLPPTIPFEDGFLGAPEDGHEFQVDLAHVFPFGQVTLLRLVQEFVGDGVHAGRYQFHIHPYSFAAADDGCCKISTMGDGKVELFILQKRFLRIRNEYFGEGEILEQLREQVTAGQVLETLVRMRYICFQGNFPEEKTFVLLNAPNCYFCAPVDIMLIKQTHGKN